MRFLRFFAALFVAVASFGAGVDGVVVNGTTGKPQANATVTMYRVSQAGPESLESVKTDGEGKFVLKTDVPGPRLIQAAFDGVTYNKMIPPGQPSTGITIPVYQASGRAGGARVDQHFLMLEPTTTGQMAVNETFVWENGGKTTFNDPANGTLQLYIPGGAKEVTLNVLAPQGMPIRRAPDKTGTPDVYKVDFPIKPGQSRVDLSYAMPFNSPGAFSSKVFYKGAPTRVIAPPGVTFAGDGLTSMGKGPMDATIYSTDLPSFTVQVAGTGSLKGQDQSAQGDSGGGGGSGQIAQILPRLYRNGDPNTDFWSTANSVKWILLLVFSILGLGFTLLYRASPVVAPVAKPEVKAKIERGRR